MRLLLVCWFFFFRNGRRSARQKGRAEPRIMCLSRASAIACYVWRGYRLNWDRGAWIFDNNCLGPSNYCRLSTVLGVAVAEPCLRCLAGMNVRQGSAPGRAVEIAVGEMEERDGGAPLPGVAPQPLRTPGLILHGDRLIHGLCFFFAYPGGNRWCAPNMAFFW